MIGFLVAFIRFKYLKETITEESRESVSLRAIPRIMKEAYLSIFKSVKWMNRSLKFIVLIEIVAAFFVAMAMLRILLGFPIAYLMAAGYIIIIILSFFTPVEFVPVAFDSGGVTTGPMTVPIILALGLGFSSVLAGKSAMSDGFGLIGLASIGPVIGVMVMGMVLS